MTRQSRLKKRRTAGRAAGGLLTWLKCSHLAVITLTSLVQPILSLYNRGVLSGVLDWISAL